MEKKVEQMGIGGTEKGYKGRKGVEREGQWRDLGGKEREAEWRGQVASTI